MGTRAWSRAWRVALATSLVLVACAATALADASLPVGPRLSAVVASFATGTLHVSVEASSGLSAVGFFDGSGAGLATETVAPGDISVGFDLRLLANTSVHAIGYGPDGEPVWESPPTALARATYAPRSPKMAVLARTLVGSRPAFRGSVLGGTPTTMTVLVRGSAKWRGHVIVTLRRFVLPRVNMPYGRSVVAVIAENGFGRAQSPGVVVYNLGWVPRYARFTLIDKSDLQLYWIKYGRVELVYPVAIGMPATPTRTGTFKLGRPQTASGVWGVLRMPLLKLGRYGYRPTSYYIHGTNDPSSIGMMASHGCVRMYNSNVRTLSRVAPGFPVVIRN